MKKYDKYTLEQFQKDFQTEEDCWKHLCELRWEQGFECPRCGCHIHSFHSTRKLFQCSLCKYQASVTAGTVFHNTRTPLQKWFWMIFQMVHQKTGQSIMTLQTLLNIKTYKTAWLMAHKIRDAMKERDSNYKLAGLIEMDEGYFGSPKSGKRGRGGAGKAKVVVGVEIDEKAKKSSHCTMQVVESVSGEEIQEVINSKVEHNSVIKTDGFQSYKGIDPEKYTHIDIVIGDSKRASELFPYVHRLLSNAKAIIRGVHKGIKKKYLSNYLAEFCYKFNRRFKVTILFGRCVFAGLQKKAITLAELRA